MLHATITARVAAMLAIFAAAAIAAQPHHELAPQPTVWVACADGTGCATSPRYHDGQTVNIIWTKHPVPAEPDPGASL